VEWARNNKTAFYTKIWPRLLPSVDSLPEDEKVTLLKAMLAVPRVMTQVYEGELVKAENAPSQTTSQPEIAPPAQS
jgi:hypothetical protein